MYNINDNVMCNYSDCPLHLLITLYSTICWPAVTAEYVELTCILGTLINWKSIKVNSVIKKILCTGLFHWSVMLIFFFYFFFTDKCQLVTVPFIFY